MEEIQGWLKKKGDKGPIKGWKNRWFQEKDDKIYYYKCRDDSNSLGYIDISKVVRLAKTGDGAFGFSITVSTGRTYVLQAFTDADRQDWLRILKERTSVTVDNVDWISWHPVEKASIKN